MNFKNLKKWTSVSSTSYVFKTIISFFIFCKDRKMHASITSAILSTEKYVSRHSQQIITMWEEKTSLYYLNTSFILRPISEKVKLSSYSSLCLNNKLSLNPRETLSEIEHLHTLASVQH